ncbi:MAG TPA: hypothetical protein VGH50_10615 [Candidatus Binatia bacterium]|jgi:hypothetical protein
MRNHRALLISLFVALFITTAPAFAQPRFDPPGLQRALAAQANHTYNLLQIPGIAGTAVGVGADGQAVVRIYTEKAGIGGLPQKLDGVAVDVQVTGKIQALKGPHIKGGVDPTDQFDKPVPLGVSSGSVETIEVVGRFITCTGGTLGGRLRNGSGSYYALSNNHVYALSNDGSAGDAIVQPSPADTNCDASSSNDIGTLSAFVPLVFDGSDNTVDAAIAATTTSDVQNQFWDGATSPSSTTQSATVGLAVRKYGAASKLTIGKVAAINATLNIDYGNGQIARFVNQIEFSGCKPGCIKFGDSGSLLITDDSAHNPVGLLFAGNQNGKIAFANPIGDVVFQLNSALGGSADLGFQ